MEVRAQLVESTQPSWVGADQFTFPWGATAMPALASATVAVHVVDLPRPIFVGWQLTAIEVDRRTTFRVPVLPTCCPSPPYVATSSLAPVLPSAGLYRTEQTALPPDAASAYELADRLPLLVSVSTLREADYAFAPGSSPRVTGHGWPAPTPVAAAKSELGESSGASRRAGA